jgi:spore germination protein YaaH
LRKSGGPKNNVPPDEYIVRTRIVTWAGLFVACALLGGSPARAMLTKRVSGNLVFWDQARGFESIVANADVFTEISPFWYRVLADGRVVPYTTSSGASYEDTAILAFLRSRGILVMPTVANIIDGVWDGPLVSRIIADAQLRAVNLNALVNLAVARGYDGIDLDYENLRASDRAAFASFVEELAGALHAQGKLLAVNVYAKTSEPGTWDGPQAQDWWAIGQAADQVRIMTYEYSWSTSPPGPIAPVNWVNDVMAYATSQIAPGKILQGVPFYGYDWVGQRGTDLVWTQAMDLAGQFGVPVMWDSASASPWFRYTSGPTQHTVWFENGSSVAAKLDVTRLHNVGGISVWRVGGEDPANWSAVRAQFGGTPPPPDVTPPTVSITSPVEGATLDRKQRIDAQATDNVRVSRVEFYANGSLLAADSSLPYSVTWNTQRANKGANRIEAVAFDASGNSATARVTVYTRR